jgi:peptidylprolyl isomerase
VKTTFLVVASAVLLTACGSSGDKAEPVTTEPAATQSAVPEPPKPEPAAAAPALKVTDSNMGAGEPAKNGDTVQVHYTGWLYENGQRGAKFDSSLDRGQPLELTIGQSPVIKGWTEGLVGMKAGGKRELIIPPDLAYGPSGRPPLIPPNATLDFEIEMVKISR